MSSGGVLGVGGNDPDGPQYAEIYSDATGKAGGVNPYATTGIFINDIVPPPSNAHAHHLQQQQQQHLSSMRVDAATAAQLQQQQTLAKYLLSSQSQSNTPKILVKNTLQNKVIF